MKKRICLIAMLLLWATASLVRAQEVTCVRITSSGEANLRASDSADSERVTTAAPGATFLYLSTTENGWYQLLLDDGRTAYVSGKLAKLVELPEDKAPAGALAVTSLDVLARRVAGARSDVTIELAGDIVPERGISLRNDSGATIRIAGNGYALEGVSFAAGSFVLDRVGLKDLLLEADADALEVTIEESCTSELTPFGITVSSKGGAPVRLINRARIVSTQQGLQVGSSGGDIEVINSGKILSAMLGVQAINSTDAKGTIHIRNDGEISGVILPAARLLALGGESAIVIDGTGVLRGDVGVLIAGRGEIALDQSIRAVAFTQSDEIERDRELYDWLMAQADSVNALHGLRLYLYDRMCNLEIDFGGQAVVDMGEVARQYVQRNYHEEGAFDGLAAYASPGLTLRGTLYATHALFCSVVLEHDWRLECAVAPDSPVRDDAALHAMRPADAGSDDENERPLDAGAAE